MAMGVKENEPAASCDREAVLGAFGSEHYTRHNHRRQEHLASLRLDVANRTVLELGAGIGDHTEFFLDRGCRVVSTDGRPENFDLLAARYPRSEYPHVVTRFLDLEDPGDPFGETFDIVYCYGALYHLSKPAEALQFMARCCHGILLLETCVSYGKGEAINLCREARTSPTQSTSGGGCRPTRGWIYAQLARNFEYAYVTTTQPWHEEFPTDWGRPGPDDQLARSVFVASREKLCNDLLIEDVPMRQTRR